MTKHLFGWLRVAASVFLVVVAGVPAVAGDALPSRDTLLVSLAPPPSAGALARIPDFGRKLLALRSYMRMGSRLPERWSWTKAELEAWRGSPHHDALVSEVEAVAAHFASVNPGYEIYVHSTVRSLDEQLEKWNSNASVGRAAGEIEAAFIAKFGDGTEPGKLSPKETGAWLRGFRLSQRANLAAPGLTLHGRASAIDFQVMKDGAIYAGANAGVVERLWRGEGWADKVKASITAAGPSFSGPLENPDEPWHYEFRSDLPTVAVPVSPSTDAKGAGAQPGPDAMGEPQSARAPVPKPRMRPAKLKTD